MRGLARATVAAATVAVGVVGVRPVPAAGHEEVPGAATVFDRAVPELPAGVRVQVVRSAADQLVLVNDAPEEVEVLADAGEPFLRIGPGGTFANLASPAWYAVQLPEPKGAPPPAGAAAGPQTPPRWEKVTDSRAYGWFDHRLHPSPVTSPPAAEPGVVVALGDWRVPLRVGGRPVELMGHRQFTRLAGSVAATVDPAPPAGAGLTVSVASGRVPAVILDATAAVSAGPVVVFGEAGEPMLRLTTAGTEANLASPTWTLTAAARGQAGAAGTAGAEPRWQRIAEVPTVTWLEPRAGYQPGVPPEAVQRATEPVELARWNVPVEVAGRRLPIAGTSTWVPDQTAADRSARGSGRSAPGPAIVTVLFVTAVVVALLVLRRRARGAPQPTGHG